MDSVPAAFLGPFSGLALLLFGFWALGKKLWVPAWVIDQLKESLTAQVDAAKLRSDDAEARRVTDLTTAEARRVADLKALDDRRVEEVARWKEWGQERQHLLNSVLPVANEAVKAAELKREPGQ